MADMFSPEWMLAFMTEWNNEPELSDALAKIDFTSTIGYGFPDQENPSGVLVIENGKAVRAEPFNGQPLNWDMRAKPDNWQKWFNEGIGMAGLGMATVSGKLKFKVGNYSAMIKDPRMAPPFIKSFSVMGRVKA
ncbi:SCP-2 sterol transfer family protein [Thioflexithrix psekupsensis]|uniref:SCP-2 sterol transfer family protein n=1 Tax=Thioflexithrix psekupsensis TaxID=1570016 RepID=A0A251X6S1_9GAMM|nr:SCP-2 sterol transfer family protein [Thioflexithrix psekupsensis]OUD13084.1 SCP-2 sterol transfer family protein [Thioflexithrix psekupsensis]